MKILNFGSCNIDYVYSLQHIVIEGETVSAQKLETFAGGKGLNQSIALAQAGADVYHAGCVGKDGSMLVDLLKEKGVNTSLIKTVNEPNGHAVIQVAKSGQNSIIVCGGSNQTISESYVDEVLKHFTAGDILLLQNEINNLPYIVEKAYKKGMAVVLNPAPFNEKIDEIDLNKLSYIILNETEAQALTGEKENSKIIDKIRTDYPKVKAVLTLGVDGCIYFDKNQTVSHPAFLVKAVDTTAAGDTFIGYFLAAVAKDLPYKEAIRLSNAASAVSVTREGAAPSVPTMQEVAEALKSLKIR